MRTESKTRKFLSVHIARPQHVLKMFNMAALRRSQRSMKLVQHFISVVRPNDLTKEDLGHSISKKRKKNYAVYPIEIKELDPINR